MASVAIQAFKRTVTVDWPKEVDADAKALLLRVARDGHAQIMRDQGNPEFEAYANRPGNTNLESVVLPGPIVYNYTNLRHLVQVALDELRKASPVRSGDYVRSHTVYVNGVPVDVLPARLKATDEIFIANPVPYSRKIEIGKTEAGRDFVIQVPNRIYERVAKQKLIPRFRHLAKIGFTYLSVPEPYRLRRNRRSRAWLKPKAKWYYAKSQRADHAMGAAVRVPAIVISRIV